MHKLNILIMLLALCGRLDAFAGAGDHPVQARLLADVDAIVPGASLQLGIELEMEEDWHTYWQFSGDAGLPIQVEWQTPTGMSFGSLQWPLPGKSICQAMSSFDHTAGTPFSADTPVAFGPRNRGQLSAKAADAKQQTTALNKATPKNRLFIAPP